MNCCNPGNRMSLLKFHPGTTRMVVVVGNEKDGNFHFTVPQALPQNCETDIRLVLKDNRFRLFINSTYFDFLANSKLIIGKSDLYLRVSSLWHSAAKATMTNFNLRSLPADYTFPKPPSNVDLASFSYVEKDVVVPKNYKMSFTLRPYGTQDGWASILHYSRTGTNCCEPGSRMPALWFHPGTTTFQLVVGHLTEGNFNINLQIQIPLNAPSKIKLIVTGRNVRFFVNNTFTDVTFASDPVVGKSTLYLGAGSSWSATAKAFMSDFSMKSLTTVDPIVFKSPLEIAIEKISKIFKY